LPERRVGGFGAGTFSRSYRGDFARWHINAGVHKYEPVYANQFAMFQQVEGDEHGTAQALLNAHPPGKELSAWQWDYPTGAGDYYALYLKAWFDYNWDRFPAHVVLEQFSQSFPITTANPVALLRFTAGMQTIPQIKP
jgi:non-lysosomal glucosylceramidase